MNSQEINERKMLSSNMLPAVLFHRAYSLEPSLSVSSRAQLMIGASSSSCFCASLSNSSSQSRS